MNSANEKFSETIRKVRSGDINSISMIEQRCFEGPSAYSRRRLEYLALKAHSTCLVETQGDTIMGFIIVIYRKGSHIGNVETIDVDPKHQHKGVGTSLLAMAEKDMKEHGVVTSKLEVSEGNVSALNLYRKAGYQFKEALKNYYKYENHGTLDAVRLIKTLQ